MLLPVSRAVSKYYNQRVSLVNMAQSRALITETEREHIMGKHGDRRKYEAVTRVRARINDELTTDVELLREHHPGLFNELRDVVCDTHNKES